MPKFRAARVPFVLLRAFQDRKLDSKDLLLYALVAGSMTPPGSGTFLSKSELGKVLRESRSKLTARVYRLDNIGILHLTCEGELLAHPSPCPEWFGYKTGVRK